MIVLLTEPAAPIRWQSSSCADEGVISNWEHSPFDLRRQRLTLDAFDALNTAAQTPDGR